MSQLDTLQESENPMSTHTDSKRTSRSHDTAVSRRVARHEKNLDRYLAERAFRRLLGSQKVGE